MKNFFRFCRHSFFFLLIPGIFPLVSFAQKRDNLGKEFYVAFAENQGAQGFGTGEDLNFFALFITGKIATKGTVEVKALGFSQSFTVTPGQVTTIELPDGKSAGDPTVEIRTDEEVLPRMGVHIVADDEIAVYGINHKQYSSDAFMALPVDVLGKTYRTLNYQTSLPNGGSGNPGVTPGEFWVVGVTDSTNITITPKASTRNGTLAGTVMKHLIYKGDVFLVQGDPDDSQNDLTGSLIEADQPIAVFSGHVRTEIPQGFKNLNSSGQTSRDHLVEMMPPVTTWGYSALVAPYFTSSFPDLVRILSNDNGNQITINGTLITTLNAGEFYEIPQLTGPASIQSSNPILVGQYLHTSRYGVSGGGGTPYGDPAYALIFPVEQFDTSYTFMVDEDAASFTGNFINIVTCESGFSDMSLDGNPISSSSGFSVKKFPNSKYVYTQIIVSQGSHKISASLPFGITVYAMGGVDSYAYPGGSLIDSFRTNSKNIEYRVSSKKIINDTAGANIYLPIYLKSNAAMPSLDMVMHYPTAKLTYLRSVLPSGKSIDIQGEQWVGRAKLHFDVNDIATLKDSLAGYSVFTRSPGETDCFDVVFDSMAAAVPDDPCTGSVRVTSLTPIVKGLIGSSIWCLTVADVSSDPMPSYNMGITFRPNPAKDIGSILSEIYSGKLTIKFVGELGIVLKELSLDIIAGIPSPIDLNFLPVGTFYLNITTSKFSQTIPFVHLR